MKHVRQSYAREICTLITLIAAFFVLREIIVHRDAILSAVFSETGFICICFLTAAINLALVIKIHFRMIVIRYYEKDTRLRLFEE